MSVSISLQYYWIIVVTLILCSVNQFKTVLVGRKLVVLLKFFEELFGQIHSFTNLYVSKAYQYCVYDINYNIIINL